MSLYGSLALAGAAATLVVGYVYQKYLPAPPPRIAGIDLGTTFSSIGVYHFKSGETQLFADADGRKSIPSVVGFQKDGKILIGTPAVAQSELNARGTIYDAKRFIGRSFVDDEEFQREYRERYPFAIRLNESGDASFEIPIEGGSRLYTPEDIGSLILRHLRGLAEAKLSTPIRMAVLSVPAEFSERQRNATRKAAELAGLEVLRIISEPTAAALAYGLHTKPGVEYVLVVDVGGGTLDVSLLWLQGGMFITTAMAGNNRLGGQDFNQRLLLHLKALIREQFGSELTSEEGLQHLRLAIEAAKLRLTTHHTADIHLDLPGLGHFRHRLTRDEFERLNEDLFQAILEPIEAALEDGGIAKEDVDEVVLVGGSTRIPRVRSIVGRFFAKAPNYGVDPELAVATGVAVQAGVLGGGWPLKVAAAELPSNQRKRHLYTPKAKPS